MYRAFAAALFREKESERVTSQRAWATFETVDISNIVNTAGGYVIQYFSVPGIDSFFEPHKNKLILPGSVEWHKIIKE